MIRLHHLNQSRSLRILWLLEELGMPYEVVSYQRNATTNLAPQSLKNIHPLGKSPVIELDGQVVAESGAITQLLIERYTPDRLKPNTQSKHYAEYLEWIEFSESSLMVPLLLDLFTKKAGVGDNPFLSGYVKQEKDNLLNYLEEQLTDKSYLVDGKLSGADFMLAFDLIMLNQSEQLETYRNIKRYVHHLSELESFKRAMQLEAQFDATIT